MSLPQVVILAIIQGLTEFLPVSSSGHLVILQKFFRLPTPPVLFDVLVHVGTLGAILFYFREELGEIIKDWQRNLSLFKTIIVGTLPAAFSGMIFEKQILATFDLLPAVGVSFLITAILLFSTRYLGEGKRHFNKLKWQDGAFIGTFQALALLPGISRSGATITASLARKVNRETSFRFSLYLAIPAIIGALGLQLSEISSLSTDFLYQGFLGMAISGFVGFFALGALKKVLIEAKLFWFGLYCLFLGIILLLSSQAKMI